MESSLPPADEPTPVGCLVQWTKRYERPNGRPYAPVPSRRIFPGSYQFESKCVGDGELFFGLMRINIE